jgi:hypothetical protein
MASLKFSFNNDETPLVMPSDGQFSSSIILHGVGI